ncbi:MAG TPA: hypothetical protein VGQ11_13910, partial [Candidatus Acidoferrales bacterium]|nr:hypothetical protein [Candidatus Acidoferrales bacterium]
MIEESQIIPLLLERCPKFRSRWQQHRKWWRGEEAGIYNDLAELAHFVVDSYAAGDMESVQAAFDAAENL